MYLVKIISSKLSSSKRLVKFLRLGKSDIQEKYQLAAPGIDAAPIENMVALYTNTSENGKSVIVGYINQNQIADPGETRIFSTDDSGELKFFLHLKNNGTAEFGGDSKNMVRFQELEQAFDELKMDFNNLVNVFNTHTHPTAPTGPISIPSPGPGFPVSVSSADISGAKIEEIKTL